MSPELVYFVFVDAPSSPCCALTTGIWTKSLTTNTGLPRTTITKVLKTLEGRKTVKTVKSVKVSSVLGPSLLLEIECTELNS